MRRPDVSAAGDASIAVGGNLGSASTTNIDTQVLGVSSMPVALAARDPRPVFTAVGLDRFTGRDWLAGEVDRFTAANQCGYVFVEAEAGLGKTAFAAWLVQKRGYPSHFSRHAGGRLVRVALQNLSAQLITGFGLEELAPGGMLPEWAQDPGGFESLLGIAAGRARKEGRPLVLVVDGLDEAEASGDGLPFGLPGLLPDGVFVVATYRAGRSPGRPDAPATTILIRKDDPRNRGDIEEFLAAAAAEEVLAARLAEAGTDPAEFTRVLAERCDGVWVYLRYVVDEVRIGLRHPDAVADLPVGLREYYADQVRRWQRDPAWDSGLLPLAATLAVSGEPMTAATLARLAGGLDPVQVRLWCDFTFRPLLTVTQTTAAGLPLRYEIYHVSFREALKAHHAAPGYLGQSSEAAALAGELAQAALDAHNRIAGIYLACFGGLDTGLAGLAANPGTGGVDSGYPLRNLARHLDHAGRPADLHRLLAAGHTASGNRHVSTWFAAHDHAGSVISYLDDLARASQDSALATRRALEDRRPAASLGTELRYALMAASITSRTASVPASLLRRVIRAGVWAPRQGLDHARRLTDPRSRFDALTAVHSYVNADERATVAAEALAAATAIRDESARARAMRSLAARLPADLMPRALAAATAITDDFFRAQALGSLAARLPADLMPRALAAATAITDDFFRAAALGGLAPRLPADLMPRALTAATAITDESARARALGSLAPRLPADLMPRALAAATAIADDSARAEVLGSLAARLPADEQAAVLAQALTAATAITDDSARARMLGSLAARFPADEQAAVLAQALTAATAITDDSARARILGSLAARLPADEQGAVLAQALAAATAITDDSARAEALDSLAARLPADEQAAVLAQALTAATAIRNDSARARMLGSLAFGLPADLMPRALAAATAIADDSARAEVLGSLAARLPADLMPRALAAATAITDDSVRAEALGSLAARLPADLMPRALAAATAITDDFFRTRALGSLAARPPADLMPRALAAATAITDDSARARMLGSLAARLPADLMPQALTAATAITDHSARARALGSLAPRLPADLMPQALTAATAITDDYSRAEVLGSLAARLPADEQAAVLAQALTAATAITDDYSRAEALGSLAPRLPADLMPRALAAATAIADDSARAEALGSLAARLPADEQAAVLAQALTAATGITDDSARARMLDSLAARFPADEQAAVLAQALTAATAITDDSARARMLGSLAARLPADLMPQALTAATAITNDSARARALGGLAPRLPADLMPRALTAATAITNDSARAEALGSLAARLPTELLGDALIAAPKTTAGHLAALLIQGQRLLLPDSAGGWLELLRNAVDGTNRAACLGVITRVAPVISEIGGAAAVRECVSAIEDTHRLWP